MSAATVLTSAMSGMPALSGTGGSLAALIRHIAPILGWSIEFDNSTDIIVIKPQSYGGGQALFYRFDDRAARGGAAPRVAEVKAYESMSDINTGAGLVGPGYIPKSYTADTISRSYIVAGDMYGFFINTFSFSPGNEPLAISYFGFTNQLDQNMPVCLLFAEQYDGNGSGSRIVCQGGPDWAGSPGLYMHRSLSGQLNKLVTVRSSGINDILGHGIGTFRKSGQFNDYKPWPTGSTIVAPVYINDGDSYSLNTALPAYARQSQKTDGYIMLQAWDGVGISGWDAGSLLISLGDDYRP